MNVVVIVWLLTLVVLAYNWFWSWFEKSSYTDHLVGGDSLAVNILMAVLLMILYYSAAKMMTGHWRKLGARSLTLTIYDAVLVPIAALTWPLSFDMFKIVSVLPSMNATAIGSAILLASLLVDPGHLVHRYYARVGLLERNKEWYLYLGFPPRTFADVIPFFLILQLIYFFPLVF